MFTYDHYSISTSGSVPGQHAGYVFKGSLVIPLWEPLKVRVASLEVILEPPRVYLVPSAKK